MIGLRIFRVFALAMLIAPLVVACGERNPVSSRPEDVDRPSATGLNRSELPEDAEVQTAEEAVAIAMSSGIGEVGRDGQPIRIVETRLSRLGIVTAGTWARSDAGRSDDERDVVWEVDLENLWVGHSCMMGSPPEACHWTDLVVVVHAQSGEVIGYRHPDHRSTSR